MENNKNMTYIVQMAENEFTDFKDTVSLVYSEPEPLSFLSLDSYEKTQSDSEKTTFQIHIYLSNRKNEIER